MSTIEEVPFPDVRIKNAPWLGAERENCPACGDDAMIVVGVSNVGTDEAAPCRRCQKGFMLEFGYGRRTIVVGGHERKEFFHDPHPPWGPNGYWARHSGDGVDEPEPESEPLPLEENARRMKILAEAMGGGFTDEMLDDLYRDDLERVADHFRGVEQQTPSGAQAMTVAYYRRLLVDHKVTRQFVINKVLPRLDAQGLGIAKVELEKICSSLPPF